MPYSMLSRMAGASRLVEVTHGGKYIVLTIILNADAANFALRAFGAHLKILVITHAK